MCVCELTHSYICDMSGSSVSPIAHTGHDEMREYLYMCTCMYLYIYKSMYVYIMYIYVYEYIQIYVYVYVCE